MSLVLSSPPKFIAAQNPIEFIYTANAIIIPPTYDCVLVQINGNNDLCNKKITVGGKDYVFTPSPTNPLAPYIIPLTGWVGCVPPVAFKYCELAARIIDALNNKNQTTFLALGIGESKTICGGALAVSVCNELVAPYISFFILAKNVGPFISASTNSSNITLTVICDGRAASNYSTLRMATFVEVETKNNSGEFYTLPQFISSPELVETPKQFGLTNPNDFYIPANSTQPLYFADIQSACNVHFAEDLPKLINEYGGNLPKIKHCKQSIKRIKVSRAAVSQTGVFDGTEINYSPDGTVGDGIYTILNARLQSYQNSLYKFGTTQIPNTPFLNECGQVFKNPFTLEPYFEGTKLFLNTTQNKTIAVSDYEWLYFWNEFANGLNVRMEFLATYADGTTYQAISGLPFTNIDDCEGGTNNGNSLIQIPIHHLWEASEIPDIENLASLCVWINTTRITPPSTPLVASTRVSTKYTYAIEPTCSQELLIFQNHLGQFETIALAAPIQIELDIAKDNYVKKENASRRKITQTLNIASSQSYQADISSNASREQSIALLTSPSVYWIEKTTKTLEGCACPVSDCEQEARNMMDILRIASIEYYNLTSVFPCGIFDIVQIVPGWLGSVGGSWVESNFLESRCYNYRFVCGFLQGIEYTYIIAEPKNPSDRTYITCMHDNGGVPKSVNFESDLPNASVPPLPVLPLSPIPATPPNYHVDYVDYAGRCGVPITTEALVPINILNANIVLEEIKNELGIYRIAFRKETNINLGGIDNA